MKYNLKQSIAMSIPEFKSLIRECMRVELELISNKLITKKEPSILSRKDAARHLQVDTATLWRWTQEGLISNKKVGRRVYYLRTDIENLLISTL